MTRVRSYLLIMAVSGLISIAGYPVFRDFAAGFVEDDAYFYAQIGYNIGTGGVSTFDGINPTNGYHLLWQGILAAVSALVSLFSLDKGAHFAGMLTCYFSICGILIREAARPWGQRMLLAGCILFVSLLMETGLLCLLLWLIIRPCLLGRAIGSDASSRVALILLPLARVDAILIMAPLLLVLHAPRDLPALLRAAKFLMIGIALHLGVLKWTSGEWVTVSALAKSGHLLSWRANLAESFRPGPAGFRALLALALVSASLGLVCLTKSRERRVLFSVAISMLFWLLVHGAANPKLRSWYLLPVFVFSSLVAFRIPERRLRAAFMSLLIIPIGAVATTRVMNIAGREEVSASVATFMSEVPRRVPADAKIFMVDGSGYPGYFTRRCVVNGDGLVNSMEYLRRLREGQLGGYLRENDIGFVAVNTAPVGDEVVRVGGLVVSRAELETLVPPDPGCPAFLAFGLYRVRDERMRQDSGTGPAP